MITITEVGPRDGLQSEKKWVPTEIKLEWINKIIDAGIKNIEVTSFVSAKKIPKLSDHFEIANKLAHQSGINYIALVPNLVGLQKAITTNINSITIFGSASESFSNANINCSKKQSLARFTKLMPLAKANNMYIRGAVSCSFYCPYEGKIQPKLAIDYALKLLKLGCDEILFCDTTGQAQINDIQDLFLQLDKTIDFNKVAMHFHELNGENVINNVNFCIKQGINKFDSALGGIGGCPYAPKAGHNIATEVLVDLLKLQNIDLYKLQQAKQFILQYL